MNGPDEHVDEHVELADPGDDRPGLEDLGDDLDEDDDLEDEDEADDDEDDEDDDFDDELEEATEEDVDFMAALYREDGHPVAAALPLEHANDLDELIEGLRRYPGDGGALGMVSICQEFFVLCRVRGRTVQVVLSDIAAADYWPLARDVADYLGEELPDGEDEDIEPVGDLSMLADLGCPEFDLEQFCLDEGPSDAVLLRIADKIQLGETLRKLVD